MRDLTMAKNKTVVKNDFYCVECGNRGIPAARTTRHQREAGHLKRMYCLHCKKETNHAEIRPFGNYRYEDFQEEFYQNIKVLYKKMDKRTEKLKR